MRRRASAVVTSVIFGIGVLTAPTASAGDVRGPQAGPAAPLALAAAAAEPQATEDESAASADEVAPQAAATPETATEALETADRVLAGDAEPTDPSATLALRDLRAALPRLTSDDRAQAQAFLARPSDGANDVYGNGYARTPTTECRELTCVHWIPRSSDYVDDDEIGGYDYRRQLQSAVEDDLLAMTEDLGYRPPLPDGDRGGNEKFDVYVADLDSGLYGYCAPEQGGDISYAFCVLDNDYAEPEFAGETPRDNMRVTAAHELFHAVQFAYDSWEDYWIMESTATWMEERLADDVDDNRNYLRFGQLGSPNKPLDVFEQAGAAQYGNWAFFESISEVHGVDAIREIWTKAGAYPGSGELFSIRAVTSYLSTRGGFAEHYGRFIAQNSMPELNYPEGDSYRSQPIRLNRTLTPGKKRLTKTSWTLRHLTSRTLRLNPGRTMTGAWRVRVNVDLPDTKTGSEAVLLVRRKDGSSFVRRVSLNASGRGGSSVSFDDTDIAWVNISLVNASTRFRCWRATDYSCQGLPRDDKRTYTVWAKAYQTG